MNPDAKELEKVMVPAVTVDDVAVVVGKNLATC
jgi:hypothetical protein